MTDEQEHPDHRHMHRLPPMAVRPSPPPLILLSSSSPLRISLTLTHAHFRSIRSTTSFLLSFLAIVALGVFYEWLRAFARRLDRSVARALAASSSGAGKGKGRVSRSRSMSPAPGVGAADEEEALLMGSSSSSFVKGHTLCVSPLCQHMVIEGVWMGGN